MPNSISEDRPSAYRRPLEGMFSYEPNSSSIFWLSGRSESGKTILSSHAVRMTRELFPSATDTALAYFYCSADTSVSQQPIKILGSMVTPQLFYTFTFLSLAACKSPYSFILHLQIPIHTTTSSQSPGPKPHTLTMGCFGSKSQDSDAPMNSRRNDNSGGGTAAVYAGGDGGDYGGDGGGDHGGDGGDHGGDGGGDGGGGDGGGGGGGD
ncbi:hypothetical protein K432DRAFT_399786 [Lepidopterella palustris CBS 459.81]|uniref:Nephrocystin 3-like N-terminal domain-containing protein n=1 Tax=Lepidopterella palustris CBS 459.81 TaxID=1314670 RepID=A0A8E2ELB4_9PEZI|nr:hypothetical protein K432DRAFT_399786 [Lepidopterella palustris CBS 459.81]